MLDRFPHMFPSTEYMLSNAIAASVGGFSCNEAMRRSDDRWKEDQSSWPVHTRISTTMMWFYVAAQ